MSKIKHLLLMFSFLLHITYANASGEEHNFPGMNSPAKRLKMSVENHLNRRNLEHVEMMADQVIPNHVVLNILSYLDFTSLFNLALTRFSFSQVVRNEILRSRLIPLLSSQHYQEATPDLIAALIRNHAEIRHILLRRLARQIPQDFAVRAWDLNRNQALAAYFLGIYMIDLNAASYPVSDVLWNPSWVEALDPAWVEARNVNWPIAKTADIEASRKAVWQAAWNAAWQAALNDIRPIFKYFQSQYSNDLNGHLSELIVLSWLIHHGHEYRLLAFNAALAALPQNFSTDPLLIISAATWDKPELADNPYIKFLKSAMEAMTERLNKNNFAGESL